MKSTVLNKKNISIVVPLFNEYENLDLFLRKLDNENTNLKKIFIFVNNGSSDEKVSKLLSEKRTNFVQLNKNLGFGGGVKYGIKHSSTDFVCWMPCNLKVDPLEAIELINQIGNFDNKTLYKCKRLKNSKIDKYKTLIFSILQSVILKTKVFDTGGTPTIVSKNLFNKLENFPNDYTFETYVYLKAKSKNFNIQRPSINYGKRKFGTSHWQNGILSEIKFILNMYKQSKLWKI